MEVIQEKKDDLNSQLTIKVSPKDYSTAYEKGLKNAKKQVNLPGFRPGHVPMGLIKKKYGASILAEEMNKLVSESLHNYIKDNELNILGNPMPKEDDKGGDWQNPQDFEFNYEIGLAPEFELKIGQKDKINFYQIKVDDEMLDKEVDNLTRRYGILEAVEESGENDLILGQFVELNEAGEPKEGGIMHSASISVEFLENKDAKKKVTGLKISDTVELNPKDYSKGDADLAAMLGVKQDQLPTINDKFNFTVTEIKRLKPAKLNDELFTKLFGEDSDINSEEAMREHIAKDMSHMFINDSNRMFLRDASEYLIEKYALPLPDDFLQKWIKQSNEKEISDEQIQKEYEDYSNALRWQLIQNKIIKENDLKVEHEEVLSHTKGLIAKNYSQYGMPVPEEEELNKNAMSVLQNQEEAQRIYQTLYDNKVMEYLKETVKLKEKMVSYDEFVRLASREK